MPRWRPAMATNVLFSGFEPRSNTRDVPRPLRLAYAKSCVLLNIKALGSRYCVFINIMANLKSDIFTPFVFNNIMGLTGIEGGPPFLADRAPG